MLVFFPTGRTLLIWVSDRLIRHASAPWIPESSTHRQFKEEEASSSSALPPAWENDADPGTADIEIPDELQERSHPLTDVKITERDIAPPRLPRRIH